MRSRSITHSPDAAFGALITVMCLYQVVTKAFPESIIEFGKHEQTWEEGPAQYAEHISHSR